MPDTPQKPRHFQTQIEVRFADCDPAGIVFYPRYFEMFNGLVDVWFRRTGRLSRKPSHN